MEGCNTCRQAVALTAFQLKPEFFIDMSRVSTEYLDSACISNSEHLARKLMPQSC